MKVNSRQRLDTDARRAALLDIGLQIFGEHPYEAVTLDQIAKSAGVSKGLLYHYFPGKRAYYMAVLQQVSDGLLLATEPRDLTTDQAVEHTLRAFLQYIAKNWRLYLALLRGGAGVDPKAVAIVEEVRRIETDRIAAALGVPEPSPSLRLALYGFIGFAEAIGARFITDDLAEDDVLPLLTDTLGAVFAREAMHGR